MHDPFEWFDFYLFVQNLGSGHTQCIASYILDFFFFFSSSENFGIEWESNFQTFEMPSIVCLSYLKWADCGVQIYLTSAVYTVSLKSQILATITFGSYLEDFLWEFQAAWEGKGRRKKHAR